MWREAQVKSRLSRWRVPFEFARNGLRVHPHLSYSQLAVHLILILTRLRVWTSAWLLHVLSESSFFKGVELWFHWNAVEHLWSFEHFEIRSCWRLIKPTYDLTIWDRDFARQPFSWRWRELDDRYDGEKHKHPAGWLHLNPVCRWNESKSAQFASQSLRQAENFSQRREERTCDQDECHGLPTTGALACLANCLIDLWAKTFWRSLHVTTIRYSSGFWLLERGAQADGLITKRNWRQSFLEARFIISHVSSRKEWMQHILCKTFLNNELGFGIKLLDSYHGLAVQTRAKPMIESQWYLTWIRTMRSSSHEFMRIVLMAGCYSVRVTNRVGLHQKSPVAPQESWRMEKQQSLSIRQPIPSGDPAPWPWDHWARTTRPFQWVQQVASKRALGMWKEKSRSWEVPEDDTRRPRISPCASPGAFPNSESLASSVSPESLVMI